MLGFHSVTMPHKRFLLCKESSTEYGRRRQTPDASCAHTTKCTQAPNERVQLSGDRTKAFITSQRKFAYHARHSNPIQRKRNSRTTTMAAKKTTRGHGDEEDLADRNCSESPPPSIFFSDL